ncbi:hypothetical protein PGT21_011914 [Puccinia graminis f. sp. tritici]|uniref:Uncharacterized protein n=1 Tax=Puccinia graminis f. sp. tritici TaxID=56615 RepID=A0A5B0QMM3_PUCGR|nr:hypothetical protein PGT21_011914 [Puccinia graminis f. sp. tritici]
MSSAVTPSDSACHPSNACRSRYSSGRSWTGIPPPLLPLSAVNPGVRQCPDSPQQAFQNLAHLVYFSRSPAPRKARLSTNAPPLSSACVRSVSSACFPHQPRAFRMPPNKPSKALVKARSRRHTGQWLREERLEDFPSTSAGLPESA